MATRLRPLILIGVAAAGVTLGLLLPRPDGLLATSPDVTFAAPDDTPAANPATESLETPERTSAPSSSTVGTTDDRLLPAWLDEWDPYERDLTSAETMELRFVAIAVLDRVAPFDWRAHTRVDVGCGTDDCPIGVALRYTDGRILVRFAPDAFIWGEAFLYALAAHELAHVWQWTVGHDSTSVFNGLGPAEYGYPDYELEADCLAAFWGWPAEARDTYWDCPPEWVERVGAAYQANPLP